MYSDSFVAHPTPLTLPRVEKLTQKRGKKLTSILKMFRVEEDELVASGIELDRAYAYKCCSPTRSAIQSGRHPYHVNALNAAMEISNPEDPVSGFAGIPRNMTGIATKLAAAGYSTAMFGKWVRSQLPVASSISCCSILDRATGCRHGHARPYPEGARIPEEPVLLSPRQRL